MRLLPTLVVAAVSIISIPGHAQQTVSENDAKLTLSTMGVRFNEAWNTGDSKTLGSFFTEDAIFITPVGIEVGRDAIVKNLALRAGKSIHSGTLEQLRPLTADSFWAAGTWKNAENNGGPTFTGYSSAYYVREGDDWKIRMLMINVTPQKVQPQEPYKKD